MAIRLGPKLACMDVVQILEMVADPNRRQHPPGISRVTVREDELASRQSREASCKPRIRTNAVESNCMNVPQELMRIDGMMLHQSRQCRSMLMKMRFLNSPRFNRVAVEKTLDIRPHTLVDQVKEAGRCGVQAIVEIEDPIPDVTIFWSEPGHDGNAPSRLPAKSRER